MVRLSRAPAPPRAGTGTRRSRPGNVLSAKVAGPVRARADGSRRVPRPSRRSRPAAPGPGPYRSALGLFLDRYDEYLPAVAPSGGEAAMGGDEPYAYYGTARSASPHWEGRVTRGSLHSLMTFDALGAAPLLADTPLLVIHGKVDAYCSPRSRMRTPAVTGRSSGWTATGTSICTTWNLTSPRPPGRHRLPASPVGERPPANGADPRRCIR
jgi:hypothetical protein